MSKLEIQSSSVSPSELKRHLQDADPSLPIAIEERARFRGTLGEPVLVALVGATSGAISALITGILSIYTKRSEISSITIVGKKRRLVVPKDTDTKKIKELVELAKRLDE